MAAKRMKDGGGRGGKLSKAPAKRKKVSGTARAGAAAKGQSSKKAVRRTARNIMARKGAPSGSKQARGVIKQARRIVRKRKVRASS